MSKASKLLETVDVVYGGRGETATVKDKITIPFICKIMKSKLIDRKTGEVDPTLGSYDIEYDNVTMEKEIDKQLTKIFEKATKDKVAYIGGHALIGFANTFWNPKYHKSR